MHTATQNMLKTASRLCRRWLFTLSPLYTSLGHHFNYDTCI